jgi:5-methylcytosine-specific restriction protein B
MLNETIAQRIKEAHKKLSSEGKLLSNTQLLKYYEIFQKRFGPYSLRALDGERLLESIHDHGIKDSLVYWLEFKNDDEFPAKFGSIAGGSALKFGIYRRKETGAWTIGSPQNQIEISTEEAIRVAGKHRDQLIKAAELLDHLPENGTDEDYLNLQREMDKLAPNISDSAWGHKYLSLLYPEKLDDYHRADYQRFHLIKMLQIPPEGDGRYICAGRYVSIAKELGIPLNHLTSILNSFNGRPHRYWRIGTTRGLKGSSEWKNMRDGGYIAVGWDDLGDLSNISNDKEGKAKIRDKMEKYYPGSSGMPTKQTNQVFNFIFGVKEGDLILACSGMKVLGVGKISGGYFFEEGSTFAHRRPVKWLSLEPWDLPEKEGIMSTLREIKKYSNLVEAEKHIIEADKKETSKDKTPISIKIKRFQLKGLPGRIQSAIERKSQVILYGPPGTGKTYWAEKTACYLSSVYNMGKEFEDLSEEEKSRILGSDKSPGTVRICSFHPVYGYEDFIEGYKPEVINGQMTFTLVDGVFKTLCEDAQKNPEQQFYLIIDEINRGDIPRIFGELITIIEKNKRGKSVVLPLSRSFFLVPENVYIIGTMNTADRSIALLDTALRRRFGFIELMPDSSILGNATVAGIPLGPWLDSLNRQICECIGHDARNLQIGHSYLLDKERPISQFLKMSKVVQEDIIPLLEEYCYEDYITLEKILGKGLIDVNNQRIRHELFEESRLDDLIQALIAPFPEISTSPQILESESEISDEYGEENESNSEENIGESMDV